MVTFSVEDGGYSGAVSVVHYSGPIRSRHRENAVYSSEHHLQIHRIETERVYSGEHHLHHIRHHSQTKRDIMCQIF